jgi:MFS family permease
LYIPIIKRISFRITFTIGLILCFLSLLTSSFVTSEHYLFFTYSLPFGIGSSILFVLGSLLTGTYFPPSSRYHILATVGISLGSPLGFLVMNPLTNSLLHYYENDWQTVKRIYSVTTLFFILISLPLFTEKFADKYINKTADAPVVKKQKITILNYFFFCC